MRHQQVLSKMGCKIIQITALTSTRFKKLDCFNPFFLLLDLVLLITKQLRKCGEDVMVSNTKDGEKNKLCNNGKAMINKPIFVEFFGPSVSHLSIADRCAVANLCAEYGAKVGYFPMDETTIKYLRHTGRDPHQIDIIEMYMKKVKMFRSNSTNDDESENTIEYDSIINIDLTEVQVTVSGPKKTKERILLPTVAENFSQSLTKMYDIHCDRLGASINIELGMNANKHDSSITLVALQNHIPSLPSMYYLKFYNYYFRWKIVHFTPWYHIVCIDSFFYQ